MKLPELKLPEPHLSGAHPTSSVATEPSRASATQPAAPALEARLGHSDWGQGLGDRLLWMIGQRQQVVLLHQRQQVVQLHLNPPDLGSLKITLTLEQDQASVQFASAHASVREAIESAMPRLREMLADSGITLGEAKVGAETFREPTQRDAPTQPGRSAASTAESDQDAAPHALLQMRSLVDIYA